MRHLMLVLAVLAFALPAPAPASITWGGTGDPPVVCTATATTGTESAPTLVTEGCSLNGPGAGAFTVHVEAGSNFTAGTLQAYIWNPDAAVPKWSRAPDLDLTVPGGVAAVSFPAFEVFVPKGRVAFIPTGLGVANTVYVVHVRKVR